MHIADSFWPRSGTKCTKFQVVHSSAAGGGFDGTERAGPGTSRTAANRAGTALTGAARTGPKSSIRIDKLTKVESGHVQRKYSQYMSSVPRKAH